jgi:hypothetical protein
VNAFTYDQPPEAQGRTFVLSVGDESQTSLLRSEAGSDCKVVDHVSGRLVPVDRQSLIRTLAGEYPARFFRTAREAADAAAAVRQVVEHVPIAVEWDRIGFSAQSRMRFARRFPLDIEPPTVPWAYGAVVPLAYDVRPVRSVLRVTASIQEGEAGFGVLTADERDFLVRVTRKAALESQVIELPLPELTPWGPLVIQNWESPSRTRVVVDLIDVKQIR